MLEEAIDNLLESETCLQTRIEIINELTDQLLDRHYISNIRVKLIKEGLNIASEYDLCPECGLDYEYRKGIKRCPSCGRRSDNE